MKEIYLVASKLKIGTMAYRRIYGAFEDRALAEAALIKAEKSPRDSSFSVEFVIVSVNMVEWGSPQANEIMIG